jgi:hypothetical protein
MIFFIDHHATRTIFAQDQAGSIIGLRQFRADQVLFDQDLFVQIAKVVHLRGNGIRKTSQVAESSHALGQDFTSL